jgi:cob(I)alamin adenosyltransferase
MKGYTQVYTGNGKGKTTAALGLAIRAAGAGLKVFIAQFIKLGDFSEIKPGDFEAARKGLDKVKTIIFSDAYNVIILEEANVAVKHNLFSVQELIHLIVNKPPDLELVITGRGASPQVIEQADLVTEMKLIKHYYQKGVGARIGIEK